VLKQQAAQMQGCETKDLSAGVVMAAGGTGGILYWLAIFPVDVIKSAMMTDSIDPATRKYPNIPTTARVSSRSGPGAAGVVGVWVGLEFC
jgi:solute carrier family 25 carnitine/acylcarnitine transporter 20/29